MSDLQIGDHEAALEYCNELLELLEELPDAAADFVDGVSERVTSMLEWIEDNEHVTENQIVALENMRRGADKWRDE